MKYIIAIPLAVIISAGSFVLYLLTVGEFEPGNKYFNKLWDAYENFIAK
jgi:hypothetical protein